MPMRDSYYTPPVRDVIDSLITTEICSVEENARLFAVSWELELLLLDEQSPERQWRHALTVPLRKLQRILREANLAVGDGADASPRHRPIDLTFLIQELAY